MKWKTFIDRRGQALLSRYITRVEVVIFLRQVGVITKFLWVLISLVRASADVIGLHRTVFV